MPASVSAAYSRVIRSLRVVPQSSKRRVHARMAKSSELAPNPVNSTAGAGSSAMPGVVRVVSCNSCITRVTSEP